ncbi:MAG: bifunctional phosphoglucose/phosphomannose isomerase [Candidatus Bipolaricaulota bacterium]|nr:bifunctional phosphoglucose/phosphomannose isomerase [Candidatus Bipolaricaulota bacterium]
MTSGPRDPRWDGRRGVDRSGMGEVLRRFPRQCREGLELGRAVDAAPFAGFRRVVALGMGGSGIAGALLSSLVPIEVVAVRDYRLPPWVGEESLVVALSYSGDTEETLAAFRGARGRTGQLLAVTSGGKLGRLCAHEGIPWIEIPKGYQPRAALGYLLFPLLGLFENLGLAPDLTEALEVLEAMAEELSSEASEALGLAQALAGRVPLVYGAGATAPVAYRWKTQLNENAKTPAFWAELPELCHNEVVAYELQGKHLPQGTVVFLRTGHDHPRVALRIEILKELLQARGLPWLEVAGRGESPAAQVLSLLYLGDWTSYGLALLYGVDPTPVAIIRELKDRLGE